MCIDDIPRATIVDTSYKSSCMFQWAHSAVTVRIRVLKATNSVVYAEAVEGVPMSTSTYSFARLWYMTEAQFTI